jgi:hypothetical protein
VTEGDLSVPSRPADRLDAAEVERRRRSLVSFCGALSGGAGLVGALVIVSAWRETGEFASEAPSTAAFGLAFGALILVLLSSAARSAVLRRAAEGDGEAGTSAAWRKRLSAFGRATRLCFVLLALAIVLGFIAGAGEHAPFYGVTVSAAGLLSMAVRWPRRAVLERYVEGEEEG